MGDLAGLVLNLIVQGNLAGQIVLASRNAEEMLLRKNLALLFSAQLGYYPDIVCEQLDLTDIDDTTNKIYKHKPDIIFNTATLQSWRMITYLPKAVFKQLDEAQFGPWLPMHLSLIYKLMQAVQRSGIQPLVVNAAFPDAVGAVLASKKLAPAIGIGNVANVIPGLRGAVSLLTSVPMEMIEVSLITQHYFSHRIPVYGDAGGSPYHLRVEVEREDIGDTFNHNEVFALLRDKFRRTGGAFRQLITAASAVSVLRPLLQNEEAVIHAPGPKGLPGGYRVAIGPDKLEVLLPDDLTLAEAVKINNDCQRFDGIDHIDDEGNIYFTAKEMNIMKQMLGYECLKMGLEETDELSEELGRKYRDFRKKYA